jgi:hypothetical protein
MSQQQQQPTTTTADTGTTLSAPGFFDGLSPLSMTKALEAKTPMPSGGKQQAPGWMEAGQSKNDKTAQQLLTGESSTSSTSSASKLKGTTTSLVHS